MMKDPNGPKISDIPKFKELLEQAEALHSVQKALPFLAPALKLLGADTISLRDTLAQTNDLRAQIQEMAAIPDAFNDIFSQRGWIIYDYMNLDVARAAIKKAQSGDIDGAEADLAEHYDAETVEWQLRAMWSVNAFRLRIPLAEKALEDYREERYHACVPVVLTLLDGMVNEVHAKMGATRRGFAAEEVDLTAWNSIAGHDKGLNALVRIFQTGRYKTTDEAITIPYRNGILHGMDLGYDNRMVAAKTWAALFATRDWAVTAEKGALDAPPETPPPTWGDLVDQLQANEQTKNRLAEWKPRNLTIGVDLPETGSPEEFEENTPERKLAEFLAYWRANNYGHMARSVTAMLSEPTNKMANQVRELYKGRTLDRFRFEMIEDEAAAITTIHVRIWGREHEEQVEQLVEVRMMNEDEQGNAAIRGTDGSRWSLVWYGLNHLVSD